MRTDAEAAAKRADLQDEVKDPGPYTEADEVLKVIYDRTHSVISLKSGIYWRLGHSLPYQASHYEQSFRAWEWPISPAKQMYDVQDRVEVHNEENK